MQIVPCLWFDGAAEEAASFYCDLLPDSRIDRILRLPEDHPIPAPYPAGTALLVEFTICGARYQGLNGGPGFPHSEAISLSLTCADQAELDRYWDAFTAEGSESSCGWLKDRWGVSWQLVPAGLLDLQAKATVAQMQALWKAMMPMRKLDLATLQAAVASA